MKKNSLCIDPSEIIRIVCEYYDLSIELVMGKSRRKKIAVARHVSRFLIRFNTDLTLNEVAMLMIGSKQKCNDHTSILNSCTVVSNWMETDEEFNMDVQHIQMRVLEYKRQIIDELKEDLAKRKLKVLEREPAKLPEPILVRMGTLSPADEVRRKYL
jgi:hypothetical protein